MPAIEFKFGDKVVHALRPEWGTGLVTAAQSIEEEGKRYQRLTLRFDRAGLKTLSTAIAELRPAGEPVLVESSRGSANGTSTLPQSGNGAATRPQSPSPLEQPIAEPPHGTLDDSGGWLRQIETRDINKLMASLPEGTRDPFISTTDRVKNTLALWRFSDSGGSLLDWAVMQTGLRDPLSRFSRQELEQFFKRFATERENHLKKLVHEARRTDPAFVDRLAPSLTPPQRDALRRANAAR